MSRSRVLIVDDHRVVIEGIKSLLLDQDGFTVVGEALHGGEAVDLVQRHRPDIVIMDISMPGLDGVAATTRIKESWPDTRIVIYTMHSDNRFIVELFRAGISGHVLKGGAVTDLIEALKAVQAGETYFAAEASRLLWEHLQEAVGQGTQPRENELDRLSPREREVFKLLADGQSIKSIAQTLCISPKTVETHKYSLMEKLDARTVTDLTKLAIRHNIIHV
jgi:DNA-binding NarL/FixJ family response regulator